MMYSVSSLQCLITKRILAHLLFFSGSWLSGQKKKPPASRVLKLAADSRMWRRLIVLAATVYIELLLSRFAFVFGAAGNHGLITLLAVGYTLLAELVVFASSVLADKERPLYPGFV
jgi:hypothetical protein